MAVGQICQFHYALLVRLNEWANVLLSVADFRVSPKSVLGGSASIILLNATRQNAVEPSPRSDDPSCCQLFQYLRRVHRGYFLQDVLSVHPLPRSSLHFFRPLFCRVSFCRFSLGFLTFSSER